MQAAYRRRSASRKRPVGTTISRQQTHEPVIKSSGGFGDRSSQKLNLADDKSSSNTSCSPPASALRTALESCKEVSIISTRDHPAEIGRSTSCVPMNLISSEEVGAWFFQRFKIENPSADEAMFLLAIETFGTKLATFLAAKFHWKVQRPLRALSAMTNEPDKSYTRRSTKARPLSDSPTSSRKHSSAG